MTATEKKLPNIIFLDMDGPLCTPRACLAVGNTSMYSYLDPIACLLVKKLCEECNAKLVISSMWRVHYDQEAMRAILNANCPRLGEHIWRSNVWWRTPTFAVRHSLHDSDRGAEIKTWIDNHETDFNNFVILDDMKNMSPLQNNLVWCDPYDGMSWQNYHDAEKLLMVEAN